MPKRRRGESDFEYGAKSTYALRAAACMDMVARGMSLEEIEAYYHAHGWDLAQGTIAGDVAKARQRMRDLASASMAENHAQARALVEAGIRAARPGSAEYFRGIALLTDLDGTKRQVDRVEVTQRVEALDLNTLLEQAMAHRAAVDAPRHVAMEVEPVRLIDGVSSSEASTSPTLDDMSDGGCSDDTGSGGAPVIP